MHHRGVVVSRAVPFVTEKVGFSVGLEPVEVGDDPDGARVVGLDRIARAT